MAEYGCDFGGNATYTSSSSSKHDSPENRPRLLERAKAASQVAFHTAAEENPWVTIVLGELKQFNGHALPLLPLIQRVNFLGN